ncbi:MAG: hypothetical protein ACHP7B_03175 [Burkholderiales bacterium]|jgi:hypothetical protein
MEVNAVNADTAPELDIRTIQEVDAWAGYLHCTRGELLAGLAAAGSNYEHLQAAIARNRQHAQPARKVLGFSRDPVESPNAGGVGARFSYAGVRRAG